MASDSSPRGISVLDRIVGQPAAVQTLRQALRAGRVHHAYRFEGPRGVGKRSLAIALAQCLLCPQGGVEACGQCSTCRRTATFSEEAPCVAQHPDFVIVGRGLYPPPLITAREASGISVEQIRKIVLTRTGYPPHEGRALVIMVRDADELTTSAANALLKTLEEPGANTHFILLSSRPQRLLDTIRSRTLAVRFGPLPDAALHALLTERGLDPSVIPFAEGSMQRAVDLAEGNAAEINERFISEVERALAAADLSAALNLAAALPKGRHEVQDKLLIYAQHLARRARTWAQLAAGEDTAPSEGAAPGVDTAPGDDTALGVAAQRYACVQQALEALERNVSPTLAVEAMFVQMRAAG